MSFIWETPEEINFALAQRLRRMLTPADMKKKRVFI